MTTSSLALDDRHVSGGVICLATIVGLAHQSIDVNQDTWVVLLVGAGEADGLAWRECATAADSQLGARHL